MAIQPYLFFEGRCEEALTFYRDRLGGEIVAMMRWSEAPERDPVMANVDGDKIMHASIRVGGGVVNASDGMASGTPNFKGFALTLYAANAAEAEIKFNVLKEDGTVRMPLAPTFFSPMFGMAEDKFGVLWMVIVPMEMPVATL